MKYLRGSRYSPHLTRQHCIPVDQSELHWPDNIGIQKVRRAASRFHVFQLGGLLQPSQRPLPHQVVYTVTGIAIEASVGRPGRSEQKFPFLSIPWNGSL